MQVKDLKCLEAPFANHKRYRGVGTGREGRDGERGSVHALAY